MTSDELARALAEHAHELALEGAARFIEDTQKDDAEAAERARRRRERQQAKGKSVSVPKRSEEVG